MSFLVARDNEAGLRVADVSGHGVPAALIASMVKLAASTQRTNVDNPSRLLSGMNNILCGNTQSQFVTAESVDLNAAIGELRYSAAAHPPMLLVREGVISEIAEDGLMLAAFNFATYTTLSHPIRRGDRFVPYTDGVLEAANAKEVQFGKDRLYALVRNTAAGPCSAAADHIISSVRNWSLTQNDFTVVICDCLG
jgi:phosphoserine phosphatase RsbU/P